MFSIFGQFNFIKFISHMILIFIILINLYHNQIDNLIKMIEDFNIIDRTYELQIRADLAKQEDGLGDYGVPVDLTGKAKERGLAKLKEIFLNEELSERLSYDRKLLDERNELCKNITYNRDILPTASVIIIYYNEPYSVILRTVHSILRTTDDKILKEIILVDDASTNIELKGKLNYYINSRLPKNVKILELPKRIGVVGARLAGVSLATGEILVFFDAHCECNIQWLEPLADRIRQSRTRIVVPMIDIIHAQNFEYVDPIIYFEEFKIGGFNFDGYFDWIDVPKFEMKRIKRECIDDPDICPVHTPTMSGGLFAINREYFWEIGSYDEQMKIWGGENLEMSFRIWQCGGTIEAIPCSRIGHIFRPVQPYEFPQNKFTHGVNTVRMAKVWMDEYIDFIYLHRPDYKDDYDAIVDVTNRKMLREKLKCKDFNWYLENVYPQKFIPTRNVQFYGYFRSENLCLDDLHEDNDEPYELYVFDCQQYPTPINQFFSLTNDNRIRRENKCATAKETSEENYYHIEMTHCHDDNINDIWSYENNNLMHLETGLCLDIDGLESMELIFLGPCNRKSQTQKWFIEH